MLNKELRSYSRLYRKSATSAQTDRRIVMDGLLNNGTDNCYLILIIFVCEIVDLELNHN